MSRLYIKTNTDAIKTTHTARGHQEITTAVYWGSTSDSKLAIEIAVKWPKNTDKPVVRVLTGPNIDLQGWLGLKRN